MKEEQQFWQNIKQLLTEAPEPVSAEADWERLVQQLPNKPKKRRFVLVWWLFALIGLLSTLLISQTDLFFSKKSPSSASALKKKVVAQARPAVTTKNDDLIIPQQEQKTTTPSLLAQDESKSIQAPVNQISPDQVADHNKELKDNQNQNPYQKQVEYYEKYLPSSDENNEHLNQKATSQYPILQIARLDLKPVFFKSENFEPQVSAKTKAPSKNQTDLALGAIVGRSPSQDTRQVALRRYGLYLQYQLPKRWQIRLQANRSHWRTDSDRSARIDLPELPPGQLVYGHEFIGFEQEGKVWELQASLLFQPFRSKKWQPYLGAGLSSRVSQDIQQTNQYREIGYAPNVIDRQFDQQQNSWINQETLGILGLGYSLGPKWQLQTELQYAFWQKQNEPIQTYPLHWQVGIQYRFNTMSSK